MQFQQLPKLKRGDKVAIVSPSFAAPGKWPHVHELGLKRLREVFGLVPVEFPVTKKIGASSAERMQDLISAFTDKNVKAVIASLGGDDQVTYIKNLPTEPFVQNPKPFFGFSDNTHFENFLWLNGVPSFYGANLFTEFAMQVEMHPYTVEYLKHAFFDSGEFLITPSREFNDIGHNWNDVETLGLPRRYQPNEGWYWDGLASVSGITWGGCLESIDEMLRHGVAIPTLENFQEVVLFFETSEEIPEADYVMRVLRALGERGILANIQGLIVGRPKAWEFDEQRSDDEKAQYKNEQRETVLETVRKYNPIIPIIQNFDIGHTSPQVCLPMGRKIKLVSDDSRVLVEF